MTRYYRILIILILTLFSLGAAAVPNIAYEIAGSRTHKPTTFTQGLEIYKGEFYESSGLYGQSFLARYPIEEPASTWASISAPFSDKIQLADRFFAEGLTIIDDKVYLLTWREKTLHIFSIKPFKLIEQIHYQGEGWGLAFDGEHLIRSDGSATLYFHDSKKFAVDKILKVTIDGKPCDKLNELEFHQGFIYANRWYRNEILKIDPNSGEVVGIIDLSKIAHQHQTNSLDDVLNGIAWDEQRQGFWITGKRWPKMYLIQLEASATSHE